MIVKAANFMILRIFLSIINVYLPEKQQFSPLYSNQKFPDLVKNFEEGHKPLYGYFEN